MGPLTKLPVGPKLQSKITVACSKGSQNFVIDLQYDGHMNWQNQNTKQHFGDLSQRLLFFTS